MSGHDTGRDYLLQIEAIMGGGRIPCLFEWTPRLLLISSPVRHGVYSRVAFIMYILVNCQNSGRGQSKCTHGRKSKYQVYILTVKDKIICDPYSIRWDAIKICDCV